MSESPEFAAAADPPARRAACQPAYREHARSYDRQTGAFQRYRQAVVEALPVRRGQVVLDVGSGTGLCAGLLRDKVGPQGSVVGIEASPQMAEVAREHIAAEGWRNVTVVQAPAEDGPDRGHRGRRPVLRRPRHPAVPGRAAERHRQAPSRGAGGGRRRQVGRAVDGGREPAGPDDARAVCAELRGVRPAVASSGAADRGRPRPRGGARHRVHRDRPGAAAAPVLAHGPAGSARCSRAGRARQAGAGTLLPRPGATAQACLEQRGGEQLRRADARPVTGGHLVDRCARDRPGQLELAFWRHRACPGS